MSRPCARINTRRGSAVNGITRRSPSGSSRKKAMISNLAESTAVARPHPPRVPDGIVKDLVKVFKLLSDETRLRLLYT